jgi:hypothetical protein
VRFLSDRWAKIDELRLDFVVQPTRRGYIHVYVNNVREGRVTGIVVSLVEGQRVKEHCLLQYQKAGSSTTPSRTLQGYGIATVLLRFNS